MAKSIWKYQFPIQDSFTLEMPRASKAISVQTQGNKPCLWAEVFTDGPIEPRDFELRGTGHPFNGTEGWLIGTFQMMGGSLVFHLYEKLPGS